MRSSWIKHFRSAGHNAPTLALGLLLASFASEDGTGIRVSPMTLATMLGGCSERTLNKYLNGLKKDGWIKAGLIDGSNNDSVRLNMPQRK